MPAAAAVAPRLEFEHQTSARPSAGHVDAPEPPSSLAARAVNSDPHAKRLLLQQACSRPFPGSSRSVHFFSCYTRSVLFRRTRVQPSEQLCRLPPGGARQPPNSRAFGTLPPLRQRQRHVRRLSFLFWLSAARTSGRPSASSPPASDTTPRHRGEGNRPCATLTHRLNTALPLLFPPACRRQWNEPTVRRLPSCIVRDPRSASVKSAYSR
mmetsp:Transcript_11518/g.35770  ORF Transcript_11518/g.35770 Transcript_11518/m.35770 type:complete len:210 (-) Transcript_11518:14-643(-)